MRNYNEPVEILALETEDGSAAITTRNFESVRFTVVVSADYDGLVQFGNSDMSTKPDYSAASDDTNQWSPVTVVDTAPEPVAQDNDGIQFPIAGRTTIILEANTNGAQSMGVAASGATAGEIKIFATMYDSADN